MMSGDSSNFISYDRISEELLTSWIKAIRTDNADKVKEILEDCSRNMRTSLLRDKLPKWQLEPCGHKQCDCYPEYIFSYPQTSIFAALPMPSMNVLKLLLTYEDVDVCQRGFMCRNIVHTLVHFSHIKKQDCNIYVQCYNYISSHLKIESVKRLLQQEDQHGLNPLELAAHLDCFHFFMALMNTKDIYLVKEQTHYIFTNRWYDVTAYANPNSKRFEKSPLAMFCMVDQHKLAEKETQEFLSSPLVKTWFRKKSKTLRFGIILSNVYYLIKTLFLMTFFHNTIIRDGLFPDESLIWEYEYAFLHVNQSIAKRECAFAYIPFSIEIILIFMYFTFAIIWLCLAIPCFRKAKHLQKLYCNTIYGSKKPTTNVLFYIYIDLILNMAMVIKIVSAYLGYVHGLRISRYLTQSLDILVTFGMVWNLIYPLQFTKIGYLVVMIQNMSGDLLRFAILFILFQIPFSMAFFVNLTSYGKDCARGHPGFDGIPQSLYGVFGLMLNTISIYSYDIDEWYTFAFLHILYLGMVPIMLINLLIALFSDSVSKVAPYQSHILTIQRHVVTAPWNNLVHKVFSGYLEKKAKSVYAHRDGRLFLVVTEFDGMVLE